ncbi:chromatin structure-remodeling complex protein RSC2 [Colletotrichum higginsianum]|nr:chromatin structure-remodeling complex protein RSC2 [Colletotrichum higginsianum]
MASTPNAVQPHNAYNLPRPPEVFTLPDAINDQIPEEVRSRYNRDEHGRIFFFTTPPVARPEHGLAPENANSGHSLAYLAKSNPEWLSDRTTRAKAFSVAKQKELKTKMAIDDITQGKTLEELHEWANDSWALYWKSHAQETSRMREEGDLAEHERLMAEQRRSRVKSRRARDEETERAEATKKANYLDDIYHAHSSLRSSKPRAA